MAGPQQKTTSIDWLLDDSSPVAVLETKTQTTMLPPVALIYCAAFTAAAAVGLLPIPGLALHFAGWVLGSLATLGLLTAYSATDAKRAQSSVYATFAWAGRARVILLAIGMSAAALHSFFIATTLTS
jgi:hypothetical protein